MDIRRSWLLLVVMLLNPVAARAHGHTADAFLGYSFLDGSSLSGFRETFCVSVPWTTSTGVKHVSVVGDLGVRAGSHDNKDILQNAFMGGIRWQVAKSPDDQNLLFGQFLVGGVHSRGSAVRATDKAFGFSGGYEYDLRTEDGWAVRGQFDYLRSGGDNFAGFSAGIVYRFKHKP